MSSNNIQYYLFYNENVLTILKNLRFVESKLHYNARTKFSDMCVYYYVTRPFEAISCPLQEPQLWGNDVTNPPRSAGMSLIRMKDIKENLNLQSLRIILHKSS